MRGNILGTVQRVGFTEKARMRRAIFQSDASDAHGGGEGGKEFTERVRAHAPKLYSESWSCKAGAVRQPGFRRRGGEGE